MHQKRALDHYFSMPQSQTTAITVAAEPARPRFGSILEIVNRSFARLGGWAVDTSQQFGSLVSTLMGPAVFSVYTFAAWSLTASFGWTNGFPYANGPLSNWLIWAGFAIAVHLAAHVLRRHTSSDPLPRK